MAYERKPGACGLFVNDKHPEKSDLTGQMDIACPAMRAYLGLLGERLAQANRGRNEMAIRPATRPQGARGPADNSDLDRAF
jgi:hypothetical protein